VYESRAGEKAQVTKITRLKVADEHEAGADRFVVVMRIGESQKERRDLTSHGKSIKPTFERGKDFERWSQK
jgi:hypothetical protein